MASKNGILSLLFLVFVHFYHFSNSQSHVRCSTGFYGFSCDYECPQNCFAGCNQIFGECYGCSDGWYGSLCEMKCPKTCVSGCQQFSGECFIRLASILGGVFGAALVILALITLYLLSTHHTRYIKAQCLSLCSKTEGIDETDHTFLAGSDSTVNGDKKRWIKLKEHLDESAEKRLDNSLYDLKAFDISFEDDSVDKEDILLTYGRLSQLPQWDDFQRTILCILASDQISQEFISLTTVEKCPQETKSQKIWENLILKILPYEKNQVILQKSNSRKVSHLYASYIKANKRESGYIFTQGPLEQTVNEFWWMACQEEVSQIIFIRNCSKFPRKVGYDEYWPNPDTWQQYGEVEVMTISEDTRADFTIRRLILRTMKTTMFSSVSIERSVEQYHYTAWPDNGVPSPTSFVDFWRYIRTNISSLAPPIVHGRAGSVLIYIALDIAMSQVMEGQNVDLLVIVSDLLKYHNSMIVSEAEYHFLYEVLFEAYTSRLTRFTVDEFEENFPSAIDFTQYNKEIDLEFQILQQMRYMNPHPTFAACTKENIFKIRNMMALPDDHYLVNFNQRFMEGNKFINAVYLSCAGIVLTQLPLPSTLSDFWRLVSDKDISVIVSIGTKDEDKIVPNFCQYWPRSAGEWLFLDPIYVEFVRSTDLGHHLLLYHISLKTGERIRHLRLLRFSSWPNIVPEDTYDVIHLVETVIESRDKSPLLIQCIDGVKKSGLFCILYEVIEHIKNDSYVDIFLTACRIQRVRPTALTKRIQYRFCYKLVQDFLRQVKNETPAEVTEMLIS